MASYREVTALMLYCGTALLLVMYVVGKREPRRLLLLQVQPTAAIVRSRLVAEVLNLEPCFAAA